IKRTYNSGLRGFVASMTADEAARLADDSRVAYVAQDEMVTLGKPSASPSSVTTQKGKTQWDLDRIDQSDLPLSKTYSYTATGKGVHAYIIDTGIRITHSEFGGRASSDF